MSRNRQIDRARAIQDRIREVLLHDWDPIGVSHIHECRDEYDAYIGGVYRLLSRGTNEDELIEHLHEIEATRIMMPCEDKAMLRPAARKLLALDL